MENIKNNVRLQPICKTCPPILSPCMGGKKNFCVQSIFFVVVLEHIFSLIVYTVFCITLCGLFELLCTGALSAILLSFFHVYVYSTKNITRTIVHIRLTLDFYKIHFTVVISE